MAINKFTLRYFIALSIIALLMTSANFLLQQLIKTEKNSAALVNISGRQRMLTQKIALLSVKLINSDDINERNNFRAELVGTTTEMEKAHQNLVTGTVAKDHPEITAMYFQEPMMLNDKVLAFITAAKALGQSSDSELTADNSYYTYVSGPPRLELLQALDLAVARYQEDSELKVERLAILEKLFLGLTYLTLILEAFLIFRPMVKIIEEEKQELIIANEKLRKLSLTDGLTGIANRRWFDEFFEREWKLAQRNKTQLGLIMIDIDYFKAYNDTYGHEAGDKCLKKVAEALASTVKRPGDFVSRFGGEEFAVVMPDTDNEGLAHVAELLRASVEAAQIEHCQSQIGNVVTISIGAAIAAPQQELSTKDLIINADRALYEAKHHGRNRWIIA